MLSTDTSIMFGYLFENKAILELWALLQDEVYMKITVSNVSIAHN
jgi:hypothetical protein